MSEPRICPVCGVSELPPRYRKCDECLSGRPRQVTYVDESGERVYERLATSDTYDSPRDVVLECGHVVSTDVRPRSEETVRCPFHRCAVRVERVHDGVEVPVAKPSSWRPPTRAGSK